MKKLLLIISLLFSIAFYTYSESVDSITVSGRLINVTKKGPKYVTINECDVWDGSTRKVATIDSLGNFKARVPLSYPHTFSVAYNRRLFVNAFAEPGDSIDIVIDGNTLGFEVSGDKEKFNKVYSKAFYGVRNFFSNVSLPHDTTPINEYLPAFKRVLNNINDSIAVYVSQNSISDDVAEFLYTGAKFELANLACGYQGQDSIEQVAFFLDPLFDIYNPVNTKLMIFPYHLSALMANSPDIVYQMPRSLQRDIAYASTDGEIKPDRSEFTNKAYYDRIYGVNEGAIKVDELPKGNMIVYEDGKTSSINNANPLAWITEKYAGRTIFLDVSATWCGPCRAGLMGSEGVRDALKNSKVVFVILWINSDAKAWEKFAPKIHNAVQIFLTEEIQSDKIREELKISGVPAYFIINKSGELTRSKMDFKDPGLADYLLHQ